MNKTTEVLKVEKWLEWFVEGERYDAAPCTANEALSAIRKALAEPDIEETTLTQIASRHESMKQEPVAWYAKDNLEERDEIEVIWTRLKPPYAEVWIPLYEAPINAKAIRAEALEEAAKLMDAMAAQDKVTNYYKVAANAIRRLK